MSKWDRHLDAIRDMAGKKTSSEIARAIGTTKTNLYKICHRNKISLPRDPKTYATCGRRPSSKSVDEAIQLLVSEGFTVTTKEIKELYKSCK